MGLVALVVVLAALATFGEVLWMVLLGVLWYVFVFPFVAIREGWRRLHRP